MNEIKIVAILNELRQLSLQNGDGTYGDLNVALKDIDSILLSKDLRKELQKIRYLVLPTSNLQDLSIDCGWGNKFLELADQIEKST